MKKSRFSWLIKYLFVFLCSSLLMASDEHEIKYEIEAAPVYGNKEAISSKLVEAHCVLLVLVKEASNYYKINHKYPSKNQMIRSILNKNIRGIDCIKSIKVLEGEMYNDFGDIVHYSKATNMVNVYSALRNNNAKLSGVDKGFKLTPGKLVEIEF